MPYFQVGQKLNESESRIASKIIARRTTQPQMVKLSSMYSNQNNAVPAAQFAAEINSKPRVFLQQSNQNVNLVANQNNFNRYLFVLMYMNNCVNKSNGMRVERQLQVGE